MQLDASHLTETKPMATHGLCLVTSRQRQRNRSLERTYFIYGKRRAGFGLNRILYTTATTIVTALVHSRLDYCNSLYHGLPITQIKRLQHIQNELARAVTRIPKHSHISPVLKFLHWLKVEQRIQYHIISITHNLLHITEPKYLHRLTNIKPLSRTHSSDHLCLSLPPVSTRFKFVDRSFRNSSPRLWNSLPINLRSFAPDTHHHHSHLSHNQFLSCLKTHLFTLSYSP